ncbi:MAG: hypothetical protein JWM33_3978, partial [Caulobacteraceae bacterium]|nr:hypothetical protein [Caulobacteraceae bacterium]
MSSSAETPHGNWMTNSKGYQIL